MLVIHVLGGEIYGAENAARMDAWSWEEMQRMLGKHIQAQPPSRRGALEGEIIRGGDRREYCWVREKWCPLGVM